MFFDETKVFLKAGNGGDGCMSFLRQKYMPKGGPNGGNGGKGGDLILQADENVADLRNYHFKKHWKAKNGEPGRGSDQNGRGGDPCILKVPMGTEVREMDSEELICELLDHEQEVLLLEGGKGGRGNATFKSSINQTPRQFTEGKIGMEGEYKFTLKTIADIGLVGFPNAGKSTFLNKVSAARPKIGDYPFTTLRPNLGTVQIFETSFIIADIPGLIEGASQGTGLGIKFLKHISRTKALLIFLDPHNTEYDFENQLKILINEMRHFDSKLLQKDIWIVLNKIDTVDNLDENLTAIDKYIPSELKIHQIRGISSISKQGVKELFDELFKKLT